MSSFHCQRIFSSLAGVSPKKFLQFLTLDRAKRVLAESGSVLDSAYAAGLSGPSRLHDLFITAEAMTPGEFKARGAGLTVRHGVGDTPFGPALLLWWSAASPVSPSWSTARAMPPSPSFQRPIARRASSPMMPRRDGCSSASSHR
jgi:AraC-like DNA-binding protein